MKKLLTILTIQPLLFMPENLKIWIGSYFYDNFQLKYEQ